MAVNTGVQPMGSTVVHSPPVDLMRPVDHTNLKGKTILITGGASGFGAAFFRSWALHGANLIIGDINDGAGEKLVAEIRALTSNDNHHYIHLDVRSWASQAAFFKRAALLSPHGGIDCVVANAGIADVQESTVYEDPPDYGSMSDEAAPPEPPSMRTLDVNLYGVMYTAILSISYLSRNPGSERCSPDSGGRPRDRHLVLVASIAGLVGLASQSLYTTAKHGVVGLFRSLRMTIPIKHGIRVNMINPYFVDTPILGPLAPLVLAGGGMAKVADVVDATTRLVADQSIVGRALVIGAETSDEHAKIARLEPATSAQAIWDVYADDFEQSDVFTRRIIAVTNLVSSARGRMGVVSDVVARVRQTFWRLLGY